MQKINLNKLKLKVSETSKEVQNTTTKFKPTYDPDVIKKAYLEQFFFRNKESFFKFR